MKTRALITLLCAGAAGVLWSPRAHSEASYPLLSLGGRTAGSRPASAGVEASRQAAAVKQQGAPTKAAPVRGRRSKDGQLVPSLTVTRLGEEVRFAFNVANAGQRRVEVKFPTGQTHDIVVVDSTGREVWHWADGRVFTEALQNRVIDGGDTLLLEDGWDHPAVRGKLVAIAQLKSTNYPIEHKVEFTLP